ncbi:uncharacterized protein LOC129584438 [Paramacrobiotus metropolitanus]|uniref:uncharacterized protein LOC129584438 n=1 Tax=Paramacrobiotus metropolitanus TaxID=2943436 RepID=UPI0024456DFE|nr:uncharacterized protein LOC129584438 [Paramacrobiotus metropolitanus]
MDVLQDISRGLRGPFALVTIITCKHHFPKLHAARNLVQKRRDTDFTNLGFSLLLASLGSFVFWDFSEWIKEGDFSIDNITAQFSNYSSTFSKLGITLIRWKFYVGWCCIGLLPGAYSFLIQTLFYLHCRELEKGVDEYYQQLQELANMLCHNKTVPGLTQKIDELLSMRNRLYALTECINDAFQGTAGALFCTDVAVMLFSAALVQVLSSNPSYWQLTGVVLYGFYLIAFHYPLISISFKVREYEKVTCYLLERGIQNNNFSTAVEVKMHLDALILHESQLKFDIYAGGIFPLNGGAILKAFTLIATISIAANEITSKADSSPQNLLPNCGTA